MNLKHTYKGGGSKPETDSNSKEYMLDIFGSKEYSTVPHLEGWGSGLVFDNTKPNSEKYTNNVMGGTEFIEYFSPLQTGMVHMNLASKNIGKYIRQGVKSEIPYRFTSDTDLDSRLMLFRDIIVESGVSLKIRTLATQNFIPLSRSLEIPELCSLIVKPNAIIEVQNVLMMNDESVLKVESGGTLIFKSTAHLVSRGSARIEISSGAYVCFENGVDLNLEKFNSVVNLHNGYILGTSPHVSSTCSCMFDLSNLSTDGAGHLNFFDISKYIQNTTLYTDQYYSGNNIFVGYSVDLSRPKGAVTFKNGSHTVLNTDFEVLFDKEVLVEKGAILEILTE